jgi:hypothetical protein
MKGVGSLQPVLPSRTAHSHEQAFYPSQLTTPDPFGSQCQGVGSRQSTRIAQLFFASTVQFSIPSTHDSRPRSSSRIRHYSLLLFAQPFHTQPHGLAGP